MSPAFACPSARQLALASSSPWFCCTGTGVRVVWCGVCVQEHTKSVEYLRENEMVVITRSGYMVSSLDVAAPAVRDPELVKLEMSLEAIEKG